MLVVDRWVVIGAAVGAIVSGIAVDVSHMRRQARRIKDSPPGFRTAMKEAPMRFRIRARILESVLVVVIVLALLAMLTASRTPAFACPGRLAPNGTTPAFTFCDPGE